MLFNLKYRTESEVRAYFAGARQVLYAYAWWKDGELFVGCGITSYQTALNTLNTQEEVTLRVLAQAQEQERETRQIIVQRQERNEGE